MLPSAAGVRSAILSSARLTGMALTDRHIIPGENPHAAQEGQGNFCFPCVLVRDDFHFGQARLAIIKPILPLEISVKARWGTSGRGASAQDSSAAGRPGWRFSG